jgi:SOS-response transcriptional repressor LexA
MDRKGGRGGIKINTGMARVWDEEEVRGREMSPAQRDVFLIVDEYWKRYGCSPTLREIAYLRGKMGMRNTQRLVDRLVELGVLKKVSRRGRTIRPVYINFRNLE